MKYNNPTYATLSLEDHWVKGQWKCYAHHGWLYDGICLHATAGHAETRYSGGLWTIYFNGFPGFPQAPNYYSSRSSFHTWKNSLALEGMGYCYGRTRRFLYESMAPGLRKKKIMEFNYSYRPYQAIPFRLLQFAIIPWTNLLLSFSLCHNYSVNETTTMKIGSRCA